MSVPSFLEEALTDVLGSMCFALPEFAGSEVVGNPIATSVSFSGEVTGELRLGLESDLARRLTADFLGCGWEEVTIEHAHAFSMELANILCGHALGVVGHTKHYSMSLPILLPQDPATQYAYCFRVSGQVAEIGLDFQVNE